MALLQPGPTYWTTATVGALVTLDPQVLLPGHVGSLTGATCTLIAVGPNGTRRTHSAVPSTDGTVAVYTILSDDWPDAGIYVCSLQAVWEDGPTLQSPTPFQIQVSEAL